MCDSKSVLKNSSWGQSFAVGIIAVTLVAIVQRFVGLGRSVVVCRWLDSAELGRWDLSFGFLMAIAPLVVLGIPGAFGRFAESYRARGQVTRFITITSIVCAVPLLLAMAFLLLFSEQVSQFWFDSSDSAPWKFLIPTLCVVVVFNYLSSLTSALRLHTSFARVQAFHGISFAVLCLVLIPLFAYSVTSVLVAYGLSCLLGSLLLIRSLRKAFADNRDSTLVPQYKIAWDIRGFAGEAYGLLKVIFPFAIAVWFATLVANAFSMSGRLMLLHTSPSETIGLFFVAQYHTATIIPRLIAQFAATVAGMATPHLVSHWETGDQASAVEKLESLLKLFSIGMTVFATVVLLLAPMMFQQTLGTRYELAEMMLPWVLAMTILFGSVLISQNAFWCANRSWLSSIAFIVALVVSIGATYALLPLMGPMAAIPGMFFSTVAALGTMGLLAGKVGFRLSVWTWVAMLLPISIVAGPIAACVSIGLVACSAMWTNGVITTDERKFAIRMVERLLKPLLSAGTSNTSGQVAKLPT